MNVVGECHHDINGQNAWICTLNDVATQFPNSKPVDSAPEGRVGDPVSGVEFSQRGRELDVSQGGRRSAPATEILKADCGNIASVYKPCQRDIIFTSSFLPHVFDLHNGPRGTL